MNNKTETLKKNKILNIPRRQNLENFGGLVQHHNYGSRCTLLVKWRLIVVMGEISVISAPGSMIVVYIYPSKVKALFSEFVRRLPC